MSVSVQDFPLLFGSVQASHASVSVTATSGEVLGALATSSGKRYRVTIQNVGTNPVAIRVGATAAFGTNGEVILAGGTAANDGTGGVLDLPGCQAAVNAICAATKTSTLSVFVVLA